MSAPSKSLTIAAKGLGVDAYKTYTAAQEHFGRLDGEQLMRTLEGAAGAIYMTHERIDPQTLPKSPGDSARMMEDAIATVALLEAVGNRMNSGASLTINKLAVEDIYGYGKSKQEFGMGTGLDGAPDRLYGAIRKTMNDIGLPNPEHDDIKKADNSSVKSSLMPFEGQSFNLGQIGSKTGGMSTAELNAATARAAKMAVT